MVCRNETHIAQIAKDFSVSGAAIRRWPTKADIEDGLNPLAAAMDHAQLREGIDVFVCLKWARFVSAELQCLWDEASTQNNVSILARVGMRGNPGFAVLPCVGFFSLGVLRLAGVPGGSG